MSGLMFLEVRGARSRLGAARLGFAPDRIATRPQRSSLSDLPDLIKARIHARIR